MRSEDLPSCPELKRSLALTHTRFISLTTDTFSKSSGISGEMKPYLYANGNIWEDPQVNFRPLDLLDFPFDNISSSLELLGSKPNSVSFYSNAPFSVRKSCAFDGTSDGYGNDTLMSFNVFNLPRSQLVSESSTEDGYRLAGRRPGPERILGATSSVGGADLCTRRGEEGEHQCSETVTRHGHPKLIPFCHLPRLPRSQLSR